MLYAVGQHLHQQDSFKRAEAGLTGGVTDAPLATFMERKNPENTTMVQPGCLLLQGTPEAGLGQYPSL